MGIRGKGEGKSLSIILEKRMIDKKNISITFRKESD